MVLILVFIWRLNWQYTRNTNTDEEWSVKQQREKASVCYFCYLLPLFQIIVDGAYDSCRAQFYNFQPKRLFRILILVCLLPLPLLQLIFPFGEFMDGVSLFFCLSLVQIKRNLLLIFLSFCYFLHERKKMHERERARQMDLIKLVF